MAVSHIDFFKFADDLLKDQSAAPEILLRNSISRAYYAVYLRADEIAKMIPVHSGCAEKGTHNKLISKYANHPLLAPFSTGLAYKLKSCGQQLKQMHAQRVDADYSPEMDVNYDDAETQLEMARSLLAVMDGVEASIKAEISASAGSGR